MLTTTRQTKACAIDREITIDTILGSDWEDVVRAVVFESRHLKTTVRNSYDSYELRRIPSEMGGVAVEVRKRMEIGVAYHVHLSRDLGDSCTCEGGKYRGSCRHMEAVRLAIAEGKL